MTNIPASPTPAPSENASSNLFANLKSSCSSYAQEHQRAVCYGIIGFVAAALVLAIGFWPTVLLALFAAAGVFIGRYQDVDRHPTTAVRALKGTML